MSVIATMLDTVLFAFESALLILFSLKILESRLSPVILLLTLLAFQIAKTMLEIYEIWGFILFFILDLLIVVICYRGALYKKLFAVTLFYAGISTCDTIAFLLSVYFCKIFSVPISGIEALHYPASFISKIMAYFLAGALNKSIKTPNMLKDWMKVLPIPCLVAIVLTILFPYSHAQESDIINILFAACVFALLTIVFMYYYILKAGEKQLLQYRLLSAEEFRVFQSYQLRSLQASYRKQDGLVHDIKHHLNYIEAAPDLKTVKNYVAGVRKKSLPELTRYTGNFDIDVILSAKCLEMDEQGISFDISDPLPPCIDWLDPIDTSIILGNALSNAIESCERCGGGSISIKFKYDKWLIISIENPTDREPALKIEGTGFISTKAETGHGIGMESMKIAVDRYNGHMEYTVKNGIFRLDILLQHPSCFAPQSL